MEHFVGDDNIDWCQHAMDEYKKIKRGETTLLAASGSVNDPDPFDYFCDLLPIGSWAIDLGCNIGKWVLVFVKHGWNYVGIDASATALELAKKLMDDLDAIKLNLFKCKNEITPKKSPSIEFIHGRAEHIADIIEPESVDLVFTNTVLQHMHNDTKKLVLNGTFKVLKPGGLLVIQEVVDESNVRAFSREGWINFVVNEVGGFEYVKSTPEGDPRNGFVFRRLNTR